ncbi:MAG: Two component transcriptional regulator, winged helix family [Candidatus Woesebacteria bacterium GW2011_GWA1_39_8]|jgi:DNA-binding response OmpR family regulator|uniref:Two component transcriptional regulator, winged helix family n=1 Tax=Candidatus Woesebacteria bacterium GW2011_GWA1_39_8 TaxID=1618552 RepID=A0A0G0PIL9_9BACT|nr:MAG: Two component transcriptional regulator, winged helix family [Candidatus Woesebacteria bacterium GW2011_GWA1_39_8]
MKKVLVVDDDPDLQKIYSEKLTASGYETLLAPDATQALYLAKNNKPDLILLDIMLPPGANGFDVYEELQKDDDLKNIPVIVFTNLDTEKDMAEQMGIKDYIIKAELTPAQIVERVKEKIGS